MVSGVKKVRIWVLGFGIFCISCGSLENRPLDGPDGSINPETETVFLFGTDIVSSGQLYQADPLNISSLTNSEVASLGSSAIIRLFDGLIYVLHDGFSISSSDNVQIIDPVDGFRTINQWSTGNGTNPHDIVVVGNSAYISLYSPELDSESVDENGNPSDLIVMNLETGAIEKRISFSDYLNDDGAKTARADQMVLVDDLLYVCLQDLDGAFFTHNTSGKIGVVDVTTNEIEEVISLQGRNPVDIVYSTKLFVALQAPYDFMLGNFDTSTEFGGIEIISVDSTDDTILINDEDLGGYVERLAVRGGQVFAVVSEMDPVTLTFTSDIYQTAEDNENIDGFSIFLSGSSDVREIATDSLDRLWVSRRFISATDGEASDPQVDVFGIETGEQVGTSLVPEVPVMSIAIGVI